MKQRTKVFLITRDMNATKSLSEGLTEAGYNVTQYQTAKEFMIDKRNHQRGVVLSEVRLPGSLGTELADQLAGERADFPVVLLSNYADIPKAVKSGVDFVSGSLSTEVLAAAIERTLSPEVFKEKALRWAFEHMTERESAVLEKVMAGLSSRDIAQELGISVKTVEAHRTRISAKTRARDVGELIRMWQAWQALQ